MPTDFTLQSKIIVNFIFFMYVDEKNDPICLSYTIFMWLRPKSSFAYAY